MALLWAPPYQTVINSNTESPALISGAALYFYVAGTTTQLTVYSDSDLETPHAWPVEADSSGRFPPIYMPVGDYKVVLKDDVGGTTLWTADNVPGTAAEAADLTSAIPDTPVLSKVADYTIAASDAGSVVNCNPTGAAFTVTLLSAVTAGDGFRITIRHVGTANQVKLVTSSTQTISSPSTGNTKTSLSLTGYGESVTFVSDGANWHIDTRVDPLIDTTTGVIRIVDRITGAPGSPVAGDRYIVTSAYSTYSIGDIVEFTGQTSTYNKYTPPADCGWLAYVQDEDETYQYQTSAWSQLITNPATQAEQETGTSVAKAVTPGRQQFHPSAAKTWATFDSAGSASSSYNLTSITDTGTGNLTANIGTDFSSANWTPSIAGHFGGSFAALFIHVATKAAGTLQFLSNNSSPSGQDITNYNFAGFGDQ
jgi:hypothetical protein